jgi:hypothetical protein
MSELSPAGASRRKAGSSSPKTPRKTARAPSPSTPYHDSSTSQPTGYLEMRLGDTYARLDVTNHGSGSTPYTTPVSDSKKPWVSKDMTSMSLDDRGKQLLNEIRGERKELISTTLCRYRSHNFEVADNAEAVRKLLIEPGTFATGKEGFVYAFLDSELNLIKIGSTINIAERKSKLEGACKITGGLTVIAQSGRMLNYKRLEKLIHQDLAFHQWCFGCYCGTTSSTKFVTHKEYFDISEEVAKHTFKFWCDVVEQHPWDYHSHETSKLGESSVTVKLRSDWLDHLKLLETTNLHRPPKPESHGDHDMRMQRWHTALKIGGPQTAELQNTELLCMSESQHEPGKQESYRASLGRLSTPIKIEDFREESKIRTESLTLHPLYQDTSLIKPDSSDQSTSDLLMKMLVKEARSSSARTISADLLQLRWPLVCSVMIYYLWPCYPSAHSLVMCLMVLSSSMMDPAGQKLAESMMDLLLRRPT